MMTIRDLIITLQCNKLYDLEVLLLRIIEAWLFSELVISKRVMSQSDLHWTLF